jgi:hypothetical protein
VEDRVHVLRLELSKETAGIARRERFDRDPSPRAFLIDLGRDRQRAVGARSDDEPLPPQGTSSATDNGVCPNRCRSALDGPLRRRRIRPPSMTTSELYRSPSIRISPNVTSFAFNSAFSWTRQRAGTSLGGDPRVPAQFPATG